ncbi:protein phosphatase inhibitor 2-like [Argonauta hians]
MATDEKRPKKGILKNSSSFDKPDHISRKETKWDEMNILATHHPPDKDYGHMKVDEPPTPYARLSDEEDEEEEGTSTSAPKSKVKLKGPTDTTDSGGVSASRLRERLQDSKPAKVLSGTSTDMGHDSSEEETEEMRQERLKFEKKRKLHYNEYQAVLLAKKLMEEEEDDDDDVGGGAGAS